MKHSFKIRSNSNEPKSISISNVVIIKTKHSLIKDLPLKTTFQSQSHQQSNSPTFLQNPPAAVATKESMKVNNEICFEDQISPTNKVNIEKNTLNGGVNSALPANILLRQLFKDAAIEERKREEKRGGSKGSLVDRPLFRRKLMEIAATEEKVAEERVFRQSDQVKQANKSTSLIKYVDTYLAKSEKENLREIITDNVDENFQSQSNYQDENNDMSLVEVLVETPSIKSRSTDCTLKSKEEDNRKKSRTSEVIDKYKFLKRNDDINSKSHFQPVETDNIRKKNCSQRGVTLQ